MKRSDTSKKIQSSLYGGAEVKWGQDISPFLLSSNFSGLPETRYRMLTCQEGQVHCGKQPIMEPSPVKSQDFLSECCKFPPEGFV